MDFTPLLGLVANIKTFFLFAVYIFLFFCLIYVLYIDKLLTDVKTLSTAKRVVYINIFTIVFLLLAILLISVF